MTPTPSTQMGWVKRLLAIKTAEQAIAAAVVNPRSKVSPTLAKKVAECGGCKADSLRLQGNGGGSTI